MTQPSQNNEPASGKFATPVDAIGGSSGPLRRKRMIRSGVAGLIVLALVIAIPYYIHSLSYESTDDAFITGDIVPISPRVTGHVAKVYIQDNQRVKAGELLVELDPRDFEARLNAANAAIEAAVAADHARNTVVELTKITATAGLNEAKESVEAAKAAVRESEAKLAVSKAALDQSRAEADSADAAHKLNVTDLKRYQKMAKTNTISPQNLDHAKTAEQISAAALTAAKRKIDTQKAMVQQARAALKVSKANLRQADARLSSSQSAPQQIQQSRSQADASHAGIDKAKAEAAQVKLNLSYTKIYAPCDGFVTKKSVEPGQFVQAGQSLLAMVPHAVWITANFKETQLAHMRPGQPVDIKVDTYPQLDFHGHVDSIQRGTGAQFSLLPSENATGNYVKVVQRIPVKLVFDRPYEISHVLLAPGMSVVPDVNVGAKGWPDKPPNGVLRGKTSTQPKNGAKAAK